MSSTPDCPECVQGKHRNCNGTSWNPDADDFDQCPCAARLHAVTVLGQVGELTEQIGAAVLGETPKCNGRCGVHNHGEVDYFDTDRECPIHGDASENPEWCVKCETGVEIADQFDDQLGFEEQARDVEVTVLSCGHDIVRDMKGRTL